MALLHWRQYFCFEVDVFWTMKQISSALPLGWKERRGQRSCTGAWQTLRRKFSPIVYWFLTNSFCIPTWNPVQIHACHSFTAVESVFHSQRNSILEAVKWANPLLAFLNPFLLHGDFRGLLLDFWRQIHIPAPWHPLWPIRSVWHLWLCSPEPCYKFQSWIPWTACGIAHAATIYGTCRVPIFRHSGPACIGVYILVPWHPFWTHQRLW